MADEKTKLKFGKASADPPAPSESNGLDSTDTVGTRNDPGADSVIEGAPRAESRQDGENGAAPEKAPTAEQGAEPKQLTPAQPPEGNNLAAPENKTTTLPSNPGTETQNGNILDGQQPVTTAQEQTDAGQTLRQESAAQPPEEREHMGEGKFVNTDGELKNDQLADQTGRVKFDTTQAVRDAAFTQGEPAPEPVDDGSVLYSSHPTHRFKIGKYRFENAQLLVPADEVETFDKLVSQLPPVTRQQIRKIDRAAADKLVLARVQSTTRTGIDTTKGTVGPRADG
jgi:hypothetical protein